VAPDVGQASQAAEKVPWFVILSEGKNLSWIKTRDSSRKIGAQNDSIPLFSAASSACRVWICGATLRVRGRTGCEKNN
jgi:hypothetical protein